jgi:hypothetical protein
MHRVRAFIPWTKRNHNTSDGATTTQRLHSETHPPGFGHLAPCTTTIHRCPRCRIQRSDRSQTRPCWRGCTTTYVTVARPNNRKEQHATNPWMPAIALRCTPASPALMRDMNYTTNKAENDSFHSTTSAITHNGNGPWCQRELQECVQCDQRATHISVRHFYQWPIRSETTTSRTTWNNPTHLCVASSSQPSTPTILLVTKALLLLFGCSFHLIAYVARWTAPLRAAANTQTLPKTPRSQQNCVPTRLHFQCSPVPGTLPRSSFLGVVRPAHPRK